MLDVVMIGIFVVLVASMASLASWSDKVVKEGKQSWWLPYRLLLQRLRCT